MRKISRRSFLKASAVVAGAAALAACGGSDSSSTAASTAGSTAASGAASEGGATNLVWTIWDKESTAYWQAMARLDERGRAGEGAGKAPGADALYERDPLRRGVAQVLAAF